VNYLDLRSKVFNELLTFAKSQTKDLLPNLKRELCMKYAVFCWYEIFNNLLLKIVSKRYLPLLKSTQAMIHIKLSELERRLDEIDGIYSPGISFS